MKLATRRGFETGTKLSEVVVPEKMKIRLSTGRKYFDGALGGKGMTPSVSMLYTGTPGAGKTTMMLDVCDNWTQQAHGGIALFVTAEESLYQLKMHAERLKLKLNDRFRVGEENKVKQVLKDADTLRLTHPGQPILLVFDSLQTLDDEKYKDGHITSNTPVVCASLITDWCKEHFMNAVMIGQVNKDGKMAGKEKLKHLVDTKLHLDVETKDAETRGLRKLMTEKNRFGGADYIHYLQLMEDRFKLIGKKGFND